MNAWTGLNRRRFPRVNYPCLVTIRLDQGDKEAILTHTENIGVGGASIIINRNLKLFTPVEVEVDLLDEGNHIICSGKIVWAIRRKVDESKKPLFYDMGIEFSDLKEADQKRLEVIVARLAQKMTIPS